MSSSSWIGDAVSGTCTMKGLSGLDWLVKLTLHQSVGDMVLGGCRMYTCVPPFL